MVLLFFRIQICISINHPRENGKPQVRPDAFWMLTAYEPSGHKAAFCLTEPEPGRILSTQDSS